MNSKSLESNPENAAEGGEQELCIQCLTGNRPGATFCRTCGAPLSSFASTGPFERLFAEGHVYRRATESPRRLMVVLGMWVIFGGMALLGAVMVAMGWEEGDRLGILPGLGLAILSVIIIAKTTANYCGRNRSTGNGGE